MFFISASYHRVIIYDITYTVIYKYIYIYTVHYSVIFSFPLRYSVIILFFFFSLHIIYKINIFLIVYVENTDGAMIESRIMITKLTIILIVNTNLKKKKRKKLSIFQKYSFFFASWRSVHRLHIDHNIAGYTHHVVDPTRRYTGEIKFRQAPAHPSLKKFWKISNLRYIWIGGKGARRYLGERSKIPILKLSKWKNSDIISSWNFCTYFLDTKLEYL